MYSKTSKNFKSIARKLATELQNDYIRSTRVSDQIGSLDNLRAEMRNTYRFVLRCAHSIDYSSSIIGRLESFKRDKRLAVYFKSA